MECEPSNLSGNAVKPDSCDPLNHASMGQFRAWRCGVIAYGASAAIVLIGVAFGLKFLAPWNPNHSPRRVPGTGMPFWDVFNQWDGQWYVRIAREGYSYDPNRMSAVAFFPLYPILGCDVSAVTGLDESFTLLLVAHVFLIGVCVLLGLYVRQRYPHSSQGLAVFVTLSFALYPVTFFARMVYTESLFLFLCVLALYAMERKWPLAAIVLVIALATATRPVGVALVPPLLLHLWAERKSVWGTVGKASLLTPLAVSGLGLYIAFQSVSFAEPLAFVKTQHHWQRRPVFSTADKAIALASLEPVWASYDKSDPFGYWRRDGEPDCPAISLRFANPIYFVLALILVMTGEWMGWLSLNESLFGLAALAIPYVTTSYEQSMQSQARYTAVAFPIYLVMGQILVRLPRPLAFGVLAASGVLLCVYSAMFAGQYVFI